MTHKCPHCSARIRLSDAYCSACSQPLTDEQKMALMQQAQVNAQNLMAIGGSITAIMFVGAFVLIVASLFLVAIF